MEIQFDNHDERIKFYELMLERNLKNLPRFLLPDGYRFVFFQKGDREQWINIERSAKELTSYEQGVEVWNKFFGGKDHELTKRMVFIENKIATMAGGL